MHSKIFGNHIRNEEKKLNQMSPKSQFQIFFLGMVYTLFVPLNPFRRASVIFCIPSAAVPVNSTLSLVIIPIVSPSQVLIDQLLTVASVEKFKVVSRNQDEMSH